MHKLLFRKVSGCQPKRSRRAVRLITNPFRLSTIGFFKSIFVTVLFILNVNISFAQDFKPMTDPSMLIDGLAEQADMNTFQANFTESKSISFITENLVSNGVVAYSEKGLIRWEYLEPEPSVMVISPDKTLVLENGKTKDLKGMNGVMKRIKELIGGCITGSILSDDNYKSSFVESEEKYRVELAPQQRRVRQMIDLIQVEFMKNTMQVSTVLMQDPSGDRTTILFEDILVNKDLPKDAFKLN